jgi:2-polyprenyl-3-methyl-5-hydroxy-6-metoxy-1,4-benzoquinol methylase
LIPEGTGAVLDVGCGRGGFGRLLRRSGRLTTLWAVEQDETFAREAAPHYDEMIVGDFPEALVDRAMRFDCIVFNDVLEHMVDPWHALRRAQEHLEPAGAVVASIPNVRNARTLFNLCVLGDWAYVDMGVLDRTHLRFFTRKSIGAMFAEAGYRIENVRGINPLGRSHLAVGRMLPFFIRDFAYTGFGVRARLRPELK